MCATTFNDNEWKMCNMIKKDDANRAKPNSHPNRGRGPSRRSGPQSGSRGESQRPPERLERVALFIDGINLWYAQQKLNYRIDYLKLRDYWIRKPGQELYNAFFYTGHHPQPEEEKQQFLDMLVNNNFTLRKKTVKTLYDPVLKKDVYKCNLDVEIVIDMLTTEPLYDVAVLVSGDRDFERAVESLRLRGKRFYASCCRAMTSKDLLNSVDRFFWLEDLKDELEYRGGGQFMNRTERHREAIFTEIQI